MYYFTADLHFDHKNIIKYCKRPFSSVEEMNDALIYNWIDTVKSNDVIVVAGDVTLHTNYDIVYNRFLKHLPGNKIYLKGNHDYWLKEKRYLYHKTIEGQFIAVSHYPMRTWKNSNHKSWNLHGHSHGTLEPLRRQYDVGVDNNDYKPISFEEFVKPVGYELPFDKKGNLLKAPIDQSVVNQIT